MICQEVEGRNGWTRWIQPTPSGYKIICCGCRLTHKIEVRIVKGKPQFRAKRMRKAK